MSIKCFKLPPSEMKLYFLVFVAVIHQDNALVLWYSLLSESAAFELESISYWNELSQSRR